jgi:Na+-driven multidrug efflux pump
VVLAALFGLAFTLGVLGGGRTLYRLLGGSGEATEAALQYSRFVFGGAVLIWVVNLLTASLRGAGEVRISGACHLRRSIHRCSACRLRSSLAFGRCPQLGIAGAPRGGHHLLRAAGVALVAYMRSRHSPIKLVWAPLEWRLFKDIWASAASRAIGTLQINVTVCGG